MVWEEKKQELMTMLGGKAVLGLDNFTIDTQKDCERKEWIDIGKKRIWIRRCECGKIRLFHYPSTYKKSKNLCHKCAMIKHNRSDKMRQASAQCKLGKKNHFYGLIGNLNPACRSENRIKISNALKGKNTGSKGNQRAKGYKHTKETRKFISDVNKGKNGHQYFLESLGYFLDYYEPNLNIVVEYDEPRHYDINEILKPKDKKRMDEIKNYLKCQFFRFNQRNNTLKEYTI
jgi:hypothetical protein